MEKSVLTCSKCGFETLMSIKEYFKSVINLCPHCSTGLSSTTPKYIIVDSPSLGEQSFDLEELTKLPSPEFIHKAIVKLVIASASSRLYVENYGHPIRNSFGRKEIFYWRQWDFARRLVKALAIHCREHHVSPKTNLMWQLVDKFFQHEYEEHFEFSREVMLAPTDFEGLCKAIRAHNSVRIKNYLLTPFDLEEASGHYGESTVYRRWVLTVDERVHTIFVVDDHELAESVYEELNGTRPEPSSFGPEARESYRACVDYTF